MDKRQPGSRSDKGPSAQDGGTARRNSTREAMAFRRRDALADELQKKEGLTKEVAQERAISIMRENGRGDWRDG